MRKWILRLVLLPVVVYWLPKFCAQQTDGFTLLKIQSTLTPDPRWETTPLSVEQKQSLRILLEGQKFTYLGSGGQCYAFVSEDGQTVIKLFKHHLRRVPWLTDHLPLPKKYATLREQQRLKRQAKLVRDFNSYKLTYEELPEISGLIYIHLNKTQELNIKLTLVDKLGISHCIDLDHHEFVVQKKAELALSYLHQLIHQGEIAKAQSAIDSILKLVVLRSKKGIFDEDPRLHKNLGFMDGQAMLIDVGRLKRDLRRTASSVYKQDLNAMTYRLNAWLMQEEPKLSEYLMNKLKEIN